VDVTFNKIRIEDKFVTLGIYHLFATSDVDCLGHKGHLGGAITGNLVFKNIRAASRNSTAPESYSDSIVGTAADPMSGFTFQNVNIEGQVIQSLDDIGCYNEYVTNMVFNPEGLSSDVSLADLAVSGYTVAGFSPTTEVYNIVLPEGTLNVPNVKTTTNDEGAGVETEHASAIPGSTTVTVLGADNVSTQLYTLNFSVSTNSNWPPANTKTNALVVDLELAGFASQGPDRLPEVDDTATTMSEITYNFDENNSLFTEPSNSIPIYGAYTLTGPAGNVTDSILSLSDSATVGGGTAIEMTGVNINNGNNGVIEGRALLLWDSDHFLVPDINTFDDTADSFIEITPVRLVNSQGLNMVLRDGSTYYISSTSFTGNINTPTVLTVTGLDETWAEFNPADLASYDGTGASLATTALSAQAFTNVTGIGVVTYAKRKNSNAEIQIADVRAQLVTTVPASPYIVWANTWLPSDVSDPAGNYDGDRQSNLAEYALNGNPTNPADIGMVEGHFDGALFNYVYASNAADSSLVYTLLDRTNLIFGTVNTNSWNSTSPGPVTGDYQIVTNIYNVSDNAKFIILEIKQE
ncbi:MAG: hypothetical protein KJN67_00815, partial [Pontiella sp.]|nr:hypothetical protein [Pontiella sp.]